jgi:hypothetical protein
MVLARVGYIKRGGSTKLITGGEQKLSTLASNSGDVPDGLEEQRRKAHGVTIGTVTIVHGRGVGHVGAVVLGIGVDTIPAAREKDLGTQTVRALEVLGNGVDSESSVGRLVVVQAVKTDSPLTKEVLVGGKTQLSPERTLDVEIVGGVATTSITSDDAEVLGERLNVLTTQEVVAEDVSFYLSARIAKAAGMSKVAGIVKSSGNCQKQRELYKSSGNYSKAAGIAQKQRELLKSSGNLFWVLTQACHRSG